MLTCCTALNVTKGLPETWWSRVRTEETTVTVRLLTRLPTAIQIFYHQLKIISTWHINTHTHTHTTNLHGGLHARQIPSIRTPDFSHTYRGPGNESYRCWERRLSWLSYLLQNPLHPTRNVSLPHYTPSQTIHTNLDNDNHATIFRPENLNLFCAMEPFDRLVKPTEPFLEKKMYSYTLNKIHRYRIYNYVLHSTL